VTAEDEAIQIFSDVLAELDHLIMISKASCRALQECHGQVLPIALVTLWHAVNH
jgi:hypothetical protein